MKFNELLANYQLDNVPASQLPSIAISGIEEGLESESLLILAGMNESDNQHQIIEYFELAKYELEIENSTPLQCAKILLNYYLKKILKNPNQSYSIMTKIHNDIYTNRKVASQFTKESKYVGQELNLEKMYTWYRELQDWEDESPLFYHNNLSREKQKEKFMQELVSEAKNLIIKHYT